MDHHDQIYIDGTWMPSASSMTIPVINPATEEIIAAVPAGTAGDADRAVTAARHAFESWSAIASAERAKYLTAVGDALATRSDELTELISAEMGMPRKQTAAFQVDGAVAKVAAYTEAAQRYAWEEPGDAATVVRQPVGVVVAITPWNAPLSIALDKVVPALLVGCTVVLKPSEVAPLNAWLLAEASHEAGLPPGVFNLVSGEGPTVGEALVSHPEVDMISFTGSTRAGTRIATLAAGRSARVLLEMGGKSANIVLADADLDQALKPSVMSCFANSGQICTAPTRLLIDRSRYPEAVERIKAIAEQVSVGDPGTDVDLGPLVSAAQRDRVWGYIEKGIAEGARLVTGGPEPPEGLKQGFFVRPTVFADVTNSMAIAQEEIFGPVLCVIAYDDEDDAVRIANDTRYGLSAMVWSSDRDLADRVARRLRAGAVRINGQKAGPNAPIGGFKQSGIGRTNGRFALDEYVEIQAIAGEERSV
jgi:acyl-CoA reductase-like NAD-dependent aldehyde dehydrogenase